MIGNFPTFPRIECNDGFSMSVQARKACYCTPRNNHGPWTKVEVRFPTRAESLLMKWAEDSSRPAETVYGWVPFGVVEAVVAKHGGTNTEGEAVLYALSSGGESLRGFLHRNKAE